MFWSRTGSYLDVLAFIGLVGLWWAGGYLLCAYLFCLKVKGRLLYGLSIGLALSITMTWPLGWILSFPTSVWTSALLVAIAGVFSAGVHLARPSLSQPFRLLAADLRDWPILLAFSGVLLLLASLSRGFTFVNENLHLPMISLVAAGESLPGYFSHSSIVYVFAAALVRIGGLFPWSAWELSSALMLALAVALFVLWVQQVSGQRGFSWLAGIILLLGGGARWLLLFLPISWLMKLSVQSGVVGLYDRLGSFLKIEGGPPYPVPAAFASELFPPLLLGLSSALLWVILPLLFILFRFDWKPAQGMVYGILLASLALVDALWFYSILAALMLVLFYRSTQKPEAGSLRSWVWVILPAAAGGAAVFLPAGFSFHSPAFYSAYSRVQPLASAGQIIVTLLEIGPVLILLAWALVASWRDLRRKRLAVQSIAPLIFLTGSLVAVSLSVWIGSEQAALTGNNTITNALLAGALAALPLAWGHVNARMAERDSGGRFGLTRISILSIYLISVFGGLVILASSLTALPMQSIAYFVEPEDALISREQWNHLPRGTKVLDSQPFRATTLFGRPDPEFFNRLHTSSGWEAQVQNPEPSKVGRAGYGYIYMNKSWWKMLSPEARQALNQPCVRRLEEMAGEQNEFRWLLDIRQCP